MFIGHRLRLLREAKKLSQGDIEKRTGLKSSYVSRVEGGHTVPSIETLEKFARAFGAPLYQIFYEGEKPPKPPHLPKRMTTEEIAWGGKGKQPRFFEKFCRLLARMKESKRQFLLDLARKMVRR